MSTENAARGASNRWYEAAASTELVEDYPFSSVMVAFGAGLGAGLALALLMTDSPTTRRSKTARRIGQQVLDSMANLMPESLSKSLRR
jgi:hypothetical protein